MNRIPANVGLTKARQVLWIALFASFVGVTACSNEKEDMAVDSDKGVVVEESEGGSGVVETGMTTQTTDTTKDGMADANNEGEQKADDTVTVNESNPNLEQTPADGVQ